MENSITNILAFPEKVQDIAFRAVEQIVNGEISPITIAANLAKLEKIIKTVKEDSRYSEAVLNSLLRRGDNGVLMVGDMKIEKIEAGIRFDYSDCGDYRLQMLYNYRDELESQIKERETMLKGLPGRTTILDEETGEVVCIYPPSRSSKTTYKVTEIKTKLKK